CDDVFKLVNSSVQLDVQKNVEWSDLTWSFNRSENIVKHYKSIRSDIYRSKDKVEYNEETLSLRLKNLQKNDTGVYQAVVSGKKDDIVAVHHLYVLDPVRKPALNVSCLQTTDTWNVNFTCEAERLSITFHCYNNTCDMKEENRTGHTSLSLSLYISNNLIICNHSNPVSWKNTTEEIKKYCPLTEMKNHWDPKWPVIIIVILLAVLILVGCTCVFWHKKCRTTDSVNTVYEEVDALKQGENNAQSVEMSDKPETPGTVYCTVGKPAEACSNDENTVRTANPGNKGGKKSTVDMSEKPKTPGTVYCTVGKPAQTYSSDECTVRTANPGNKGMDTRQENDRSLCDSPCK
ncbi:CD48 antigen-like, partial [Clarias magur]